MGENSHKKLKKYHVNMANTATKIIATSNTTQNRSRIFKEAKEKVEGPKETEENKANETKKKITQKKKDNDWNKL